MAKNNAMNIKLIMKNIIERAPGEIKAILNTESHNADTWFEFLKGAENASWIAFPEKIVNRVSEEGDRKS